MTLFCKKKKKNELQSNELTLKHHQNGERDGAIETIDDVTILFTNDVEDMLDLTRMKSDVVNEDDINAMISKTTDLLNKKIRK